MDNVKTALSINDIDILTAISDSPKASVYLASVKESAKLVVYKELKCKSIAALYWKIEELKSIFFPEVYGVWEENGNTFLIEEYIPGETLAEKVEQGCFFSEEELSRYMLQLCEALLVLHRAEPPIIHRDLKPDNILVTEEGSLKLLDFDAAREYDEAQSRDTVILGTKEYASPEQFGFTQTDVRSDIYSFGIVFAELLKNTNTTVSFAKKCQKIIDKATMFDPDKRYPSTEILYKELCGLKSQVKYRRFFLGTGIVLCSLVLLFAVIAVGRNMADNRGQETDTTPGTTTTSQETTPEELPEQQTTSANTETDGQGTLKEETTPEQTSVPPPTESVSSETITIPEGMRFMLSYGDGVQEFYEFFGGVNQRINELDDPEGDYVVAYVDNEGFTDSDEYGCYTINDLPQTAGSITFVVGKENAVLGTYTLHVVGVVVSYPIVTYVDMQIDNCEFEDLTVDGSKGASVELLNDTVVGNLTLKNNTRISIATMKEINISRYIAEDMNSKLYFNRGSCYIKELMGCQGFIRVNVGRSYGTEEKVMLVTDSDISLAQFEISRDNKEKFEIVLNENSKGQNVLYIIPRN